MVGAPSDPLLFARSRKIPHIFAKNHVYLSDAWSRRRENLYADRGGWTESLCQISCQSDKRFPSYGPTIDKTQKIDNLQKMNISERPDFTKLANKSHSEIPTSGYKQSTWKFACFFLFDGHNRISN